MTSPNFGAMIPAHRDGGASRSKSGGAPGGGVKTSKMPYDPIRDRDNPN